MRIVTLFLFGLYPLLALCVSFLLYFKGREKREKNEGFYFISWLSKGLIIYQWRMQGMKFGGAGCDNIYILIASLISVPYRLKDIIICTRICMIKTDMFMHGDWFPLAASRLSYKCEFNKSHQSVGYNDCDMQTNKGINLI